MSKDKEQKPRIDLVGQSMMGVVELMNEKYGVGTLALARHASGTKISFISTGVYAIDFACGGIPKNRISEIRGNYSAGKTTIALKTIAEFQKLHPKGRAAFIDVERSVDLQYAERLGVDLSRTWLAIPDSGEQGIDIICDFLGINDYDIFLVVDSIAALVPMAEIEASAEQQSMGLQARLINKLMRVATARMKRSMYDSKAASCTILCLNQLREKIGVVYGNPETTPGGKGKDFAYGLAFKVSSSPSDCIREKITRNGVTRSIMVAKSIRFSVTKNKCGGSQYEEGEFTYYQRDYDDHKALTFDNLDILFRFGVFYGLIQVVPDKKTQRYVYRKIDEKKESAFIKKLSTMPNTTASLYREVMNEVMRKEVVLPEEEEIVE